MQRPQESERIEGNPKKQPSVTQKQLNEFVKVVQPLSVPEIPLNNFSISKFDLPAIPDFLLSKPAESKNVVRMFYAAVLYKLCESGPVGLLGNGIQNESSPKNTCSSTAPPNDRSKLT